MAKQPKEEQPKEVVEEKTDEEQPKEVAEEKTDEEKAAFRAKIESIGMVKGAVSKTRKLASGTVMKRN